MTKRKPKGKSQKREKATWIGFVNYNPSDEDKKLIKHGWIPTPLQSFERTTTWIDDGYKVTHSWDEYSSCYQVTLSGAYADCVNAGLGLSARHTDLLTAIGILMYVVEEIYQNGQWSKDNQISLAFDW